MVEVVDAEKIMAGGFAGVGSLLLIYLGHIEPGVAILALMVGYFIGQKVPDR